MAALGQDSFWSAFHKNDIMTIGASAQDTHHLPVPGKLLCGHLQGRTNESINMHGNTNLMSRTVDL